MHSLLTLHRRKPIALTIVCIAALVLVKGLTGSSVAQSITPGGNDTAQLEEQLAETKVQLAEVKQSKARLAREKAQLKRRLGAVSKAKQRAARKSKRRASKLKSKVRKLKNQVASLEGKLGEQGRTLDKIRGKFDGQLPLAMGPCEAGLKLAASRGLTLPKQFKLYCPGPALDWNGRSHWGVTCPPDFGECPEGMGPYVSISNPTYYVIAHELCHARYGYTAAQEREADACAARYGASLASSPYQ